MKRIFIRSILTSSLILAFTYPQVLSAKEDPIEKSVENLRTRVRERKELAAMQRDILRKKFSEQYSTPKRKISPRKASGPPKSAAKDPCRELRPTISEIAKQYKFDPIDIESMIRTESSCNVKASGTKGEIGLTQVMPSTVLDKLRKDPKFNILVGTHILAENRKKFGDTKKAILAYNKGEGGARKALAAGKKPEQIEHVKRFLRHKKSLEIIEVSTPIY